MTHPDKPDYIDEIHAYFRELLVRMLTPEQLQLHDFFSTQDPLYSGDDCFEEFPLIDGLPEILRDEEDEEEDYDEDDRDYLFCIAASFEGEIILDGMPDCEEL